MRIVRGNMWDVWGQENSLFCITTNATVSRDGTLVMGAGIAKILSEKAPGISRAAGRLIEEDDNLHYGLLVIEYGIQLVGLFQTKVEFWKKSRLSLIQNSIKKLVEWCREHQWCVVNLNFPGIGCGGLSEGEVKPLLRELPDQVVVWER